MSYDRLPDAIMNEHQATTLRKLSIEAYQPKRFAEGSHQQGSREKD
jgi:hypothetical protein